jgi:hypothetical protein
MQPAAQLMISLFQRATVNLQFPRQIQGREVIEIARQRRFAIRTDKTRRLGPRA